MWTGRRGAENGETTLDLLGPSVSYIDDPIDSLVYHFCRVVALTVSK
jgi:hypothetical protein